MTTDSAPTAKRSGLLALFDQIDEAEDPDRAFIWLVLDSASQKDAELPDLLRACAIPRRFDARIIGVLRGAEGDEERNRQLLEMVGAYRFVLRRQDGDYVYHDNTRDALLEDWRTTADKQAKFAELNQQLAAFYENRHAETARAEQDLEQLSMVMQKANLARYRRLAAIVESRLATPLLESLYHRLLASSSDGFSYFREQFHKLEEAGRLTICQSLIRVTRDFLQRLQDAQQDAQQFNWLDYFEARVLGQLPPYNYEQAERVLRELVARQDLDAQLHVWALGDLAVVYGNQQRMQEALQTHLELIKLSADNAIDVYNLPLRHNNLASLYWGLGEFEQAAEHYQAAIDKSENTPGTRSDMQIQSRVNLSGVYQDLSQWDRAFEVANEALYLARTKFAGDRTVQRDVAFRFRSLLATYDLRGSDAAAEECIGLFGGSSYFRLVGINGYVDVLRRTGRMTLAEERLRDLSEETERSEYTQQFSQELMLSHALIDEGRGRSKDAIATYTTIVEQTKDRPDARWTFAAALSNLGMKRADQGHLQIAEADLLAAIGHWGNFGYLNMVATIRVALADVLRRRGMFAEAQKHLDQAASVLLSGGKNEAADLYVVQGKVYLDQGRWQEAQAQFEQGLQFNIDRRELAAQVHLLRHLGRVAMEQSNWVSVAAHYTQAAHIASQLVYFDTYHPTIEDEIANRKNVDGIDRFCASADRSMALEEARDLFRSASEQIPQNFWYQLNLSFTYAEQEEWKEAAAYLARVLELCPMPMRTTRLYRCWHDYVLKQAEVLHQNSDPFAAAELLRETIQQLEQHLPAADVRDLQLKRCEMLHWNGDSLAAAELLRETIQQLERHLLPADVRDLQLKCGDYYVIAEHPDEALGAYVAALDHTETGQPASINTDKPLALRLQALLSDVAHYWTLDDTLRRWAASAEIPPTLRDEAVSARAALTVYLDHTFKLRSDATAEFLIPVVTPLVCEVGDGLVPILDSRQDGGHFLFELIPQMRERIINETGVRVPGIRARGSSLPSNDYSIQIDEVPLAKGVVYPGMWFVVVPEAPNKSSGWDRTLIDIHPLTGAPGIWVNDEQVKAHDVDGHEPVPAPQYLVYQIETLLRRNLVRFFDLQEVASLLQTWEKEEGGRDLVLAALPDQRARVRVAWLLRALVREYVPITNWRVLLEAVRDAGGASGPLDELVRATRLRLRAELPGNAHGTVRIWLPTEYEQQLLGHSNEGAFFAASPHQKNEVLLWLRNEMHPYDQNVVLVVGSYELRPLLSRLVRPEFPTLTVMSQEELFER